MALERELLNAVHADSARVRLYPARFLGGDVSVLERARRDPGLGANLLRLANGPFFKGAGVTTLEAAAALVGPKELARLAWGRTLPVTLDGLARCGWRRAQVAVALSDAAADAFGLERALVRAAVLVREAGTQVVLSVLAELLAHEAPPSARALEALWPTVEFVTQLARARASWRWKLPEPFASLERPHAVRDAPASPLEACVAWVEAAARALEEGRAPPECRAPRTHLAPPAQPERSRGPASTLEAAIAPAVHPEPVEGCRAPRTLYVSSAQPERSRGPSSTLEAAIASARASLSAFDAENSPRALSLPLLPTGARGVDDLTAELPGAGDGLERLPVLWVSSRALAVRVSRPLDAERFIGLRLEAPHPLKCWVMTGRSRPIDGGFEVTLVPKTLPPEAAEAWSRLGEPHRPDGASAATVFEGLARAS